MTDIARCITGREDPTERRASVQGEAAAARALHPANIPSKSAVIQSSLGLPVIMHRQPPLAAWPYPLGIDDVIRQRVTL